MIVFAPIGANAGDVSDQQQVVDKATLTFERFLADSEIRTWYRREAENVKAVLIVPRLWRGAFIAGATGGSGVLLAHDFVKGGWSPPAFYTVTSASIGAQAGVDLSEVVFVIRTFSVLERFYGAGTIRLGLNAGVTVGALGEGGATGYDLMSFAWSKGVYAGMTFEGFGMGASPTDNRKYYGVPVEPEQILSNGAITNPAADALRATLSRMIK
ncbi:MAG: lipid-binding SYLF domain-containing protein [Thermoanaerobaculia bacterium]